MTSSNPEPSFFADPALDRVMAITMALAAEVFVLRQQVQRLSGTPADGPADAAEFVRHLLQGALGKPP